MSKRDKYSAAGFSVPGTSAKMKIFASSGHKTSSVSVESSLYKESG